jgi:hypothetical protein
MWSFKASIWKRILQKFLGGGIASLAKIDSKSMKGAMLIFNADARLKIRGDAELENFSIICSKTLKLDVEGNFSCKNIDFPERGVVSMHFEGNCSMTDSRTTQQHQIAQAHISMVMLDMQRHISSAIDHRLSFNSDIQRLGVSAGSDDSLKCQYPVTRDTMEIAVALGKSSCEVAKQETEIAKNLFVGLAEYAVATKACSKAPSNIKPVCEVFTTMALDASARDLARMHDQMLSSASSHNHLGPITVGFDTFPLGQISHNHAEMLQIGDMHDFWHSGSGF